MVNVLKKTSALSCTLYLMTGHRFLAYQWHHKSGRRRNSLRQRCSKHKLDSAYHATVFYHNGTPRFNETVRIDLSVPGAREAHLLFLISHCSSKHSKTQVFGFGYLPLSETAEKAGSPVLSDGIHIVTTYMPTSTMVSMGKAENEWQA